MAETSVAFDMMGTTFSLERLDRALRERGAAEGSLQTLFAETLRDFFASSHAGEYRPLREVLEASLRRLLPSREVDADVEEVLGVLTRLDPAPGAHDAFDLLTGAGIEILVVTNWSGALAEALLERVGMRAAVARIISCDDLGVSKPHPAVYGAARDASSGELWMVAAHAWDVMGAAHAGLRTAWISSTERIYPDVFPEPDVVAPQLASAARQILARTV